LKDVEEELETMLKNQANYLEGFSNTEDTKAAFIEMLSEEEILKSVGKEWLKNKSESGSFRMPVIRKSFPSSIAGRVPIWNKSKKEQLEECKGKKFVDSYGKWLKEKNKNLSLYDNFEAYDLNDEAYDIKSNLLKEYMMERLNE
jgi:plasmid rolling circle replication initiator protein Rep